MNCEKCYKHQPEPISETKGATILSDLPIQTDRKIKTNRPDVKDYKKKTYLQIDMPVPKNNNISVKEYNKVSKYKYLEEKLR